MRTRIGLSVILLTLMMSVAGTSVGAANALLDTLGTAFLAGDASYLPLKSVASFLGASVGWDALKGRAILTYQGKEIVLTPNNLTAVLAGQPVTLSSPPVVVRGTTYVPLSVFKNYYGVPVTWDRTKSKIQIKGENGWKTVKVNSRPPWHGNPPPWAPAWGRRGHHAAAGPSVSHQGHVKQQHRAAAASKNRHAASQQQHAGKRHKGN